MQTYTAAAITAVVDECPSRRAAIAMVRDEANAIIEQAERRARGFDKGQWRDDCRAVDRARHNRIDAQVAQSVAVAFALSARFASDEPGDPVVEAVAAAQQAAANFELWAAAARGRGLTQGEIETLRQRSREYWARQVVAATDTSEG